MMCTCFTLAIEHDVFRFKVSVDDALLMQVAEGHGNFCQVKAASKKPPGSFWWFYFIMANQESSSDLSMSESENLI